MLGQTAGDKPPTSYESEGALVAAIDSGKPAPVTGPQIDEAMSRELGAPVLKLGQGSYVREYHDEDLHGRPMGLEHSPAPEEPAKPTPTYEITQAPCGRWDARTETHFCAGRRWYRRSGKSDRFGTFTTADQARIAAEKYPPPTRGPRGVTAHVPSDDYGVALNAIRLLPAVDQMRVVNDILFGGRGSVVGPSHFPEIEFLNSDKDGIVLGFDGCQKWEADLGAEEDGLDRRADGADRDGHVEFA